MDIIDRPVIDWSKVERSYKPIVKFNEAADKPILFMVHPGVGSCKLYTSIANKLSTTFNCYGVDSYNFYHENKINSISKLSKLYLKNIKEIIDKTNQESYYLLGLSLGGNICLNIATELEKLGKKSITLFLLDPFIFDEKVAENISEELIVEHNNRMVELYYSDKDEEYIEKERELVKVDTPMAFQCILKNELHFTKCILLKAAMKDDSLKTRLCDIIYGYFEHRKYNNIDLVISPHKMKVINFTKSHHANMFDQEEDLIVETIKQYKTIFDSQ